MNATRVTEHAREIYVFMWVERANVRIRFENHLSAFEQMQLVKKLVINYLLSVTTI